MILRDHGNDAASSPAEQRELPVKIEQPASKPDDHNGIADGNSHHVGGGSGDLGHIEGQLRDQIAAGVFVVIAASAG